MSPTTAFHAPARALRTVLLLSAVTALLSACGGGDDDSAAGGGAGKYAGTWSSACVDLSSALGRPNSYKSTFTITSPNATSYTATGGNIDWPNATCAGTGTPIVGESGSTTFTITGTKTVGTDVVDKATYAGGGGTTVKSISFVSTDGRSLRLGGSGTPDADGYPTVLNATVFNKQ